MKTIEESASEAAKATGAKSLREIARYYNVTADTMQKWSKNKFKRRRLFDAAVKYYGEVGIRENQTKE